jgi:hypothetical protein
MKISLKLNRNFYTGVYPFRPGLPDGFFSNQKIAIRDEFWTALKWKCWYILGPFGIYCGNLACILCSFGNLVSDNLEYFPHFGILHHEKSGNPDIDGFCGI